MVMGIYTLIPFSRSSPFSAFSAVPAPLLEDSDLKEIGIYVVGDRLMFKHHLKDLSRRNRFNSRMELLWEGEEQVFFSSVDRSFFVSAVPVQYQEEKITK